MGFSGAIPVPYRRCLQRVLSAKPLKADQVHVERRKIMRSIASALLALALLAGVASQASAFDPQTFFEQQKLNLP
jgi:hypothetical protein